MNEETIRKYAELMQEFGLSVLEVTPDTIRLERNGTAPAVTVKTEIPTALSVCTVPDTPAKHLDCISVNSPIVGLFYAAPAENAAPYVSIGDKVKKGQTLCIVEAMKLMNEITAEEDGIISEICVTNGQVVEFGTELFKIRRETLA